MIGEAITYWRTDAALWSTKADLRYDLVGLYYRYKRNKTTWQAHYDQVRALLQHHLQGYGQSRGLVLGAGTTLDLPLEWMQQQQMRVDLVDVGRLPLARKRTAQGHFQWHFIDLSGRLDAQGRLKTTYGIHWPLDWDYDWVISLNIIGQLALKPWYLYTRGKDYPEDIEQAFFHQIMQGHWDFLHQFLQAEVFLVADIERQILEGNPKQYSIEAYDPWLGLEIKPQFDQAWLWEMAPWGEVKRDKQVQNLVGFKKLNFHT